VLYGVAGVLALTTGRIMRWWQGRIVRPRLWGCGALLSCAGVVLFQLGRVASGMTVIDVVYGSGMALFVSGAVMQSFGQRVGRKLV
jgi:hypothetical protein